jgi:hypothetical protein
MLSRGNADDAVFSCGVLVLDAGEDHTAVGVAQWGDRLRGVSQVRTRQGGRGVS